MTTPIKHWPGLSVEQQPTLPQLKHWETCSTEQLIQQVAAAGIHGMGGGGFSSAKKLRLAVAANCRQLIANGVECEPGISCDAALLATYKDRVLDGMRIVLHCLDLGWDGGLVGELDEPQPTSSGILALGTGVAQTAAIDLHLTPHISQRWVESYPGAGAERALCEEVCNVQIGAYEYPLDHQLLVFNVATLFAIGQAVIDGFALNRRVVTVAGENYWVALDTPIVELMPGNSRTGGHWTGRANDNDAKVTGATNAVWPQPNTQPADGCINCNYCTEACPVDIAPQALWRTLTTRSAVANPNKLPATVDACIECGKCDAVCPSHILLLASFQGAKTARRQVLADEAIAQRAKQRFARHSQRETERSAQLQQKREQRLAQKRVW